MNQEQLGVAQGFSPLNASGLADVLLGLMLIIVLIFALAWLFKKFGSAGLGLGGLIKVVAAMSLGGRDRIALISVGEKQMLLGISPGRISTLHVFDEAIDLEAQKIGLSTASANSSDFASKLQNLISGGQK